MKGPVLLGKETLSLLPSTVREYLENTPPSLHQLMLHEGGLGDYLDTYCKAIDEAIRLGEQPPKIEKPEDFLKYADKETDFPTKGFYSNLGLLLVGLSLQHRTGIPFNDLLKKYVTGPDAANMKGFSLGPPSTRAMFDPSNPMAGKMCGSPAGGYWVTAQDLCAFGSWMSKLWTEKPSFEGLIETYGKEFYEKGEIRHSGMFDSASAYLSIFPKQGVTIAILADKRDPKLPNSEEINNAIRSHMMNEPLS